MVEWCIRSILLNRMVITLMKEKQILFLLFIIFFELYQLEVHSFSNFMRVKRRNDLKNVVDSDQSFPNPDTLFRGINTTLNINQNNIQQESECSNCTVLRHKKSAWSFTSMNFTDGDQLIKQAQDHIENNLEQPQFEQNVVNQSLKIKEIPNSMLIKSSEFNKHSVKIKEHIENYRVANICKNVIKKLKRNNIYSRPIEEDELAQFQREQVATGFSIKDSFTSVWQLFGTMTLLLMFFFQTFALVFPQLDEGVLANNLSMLTILFFIGEISSNFLLVKRINGRKVVQLKQLAKYYIVTYFFIDFLLLILTIISLCSSDIIWNRILLIVFILKINNLVQKLTKIQKFIVKSFYYEKYWSLMKIILFNFAFAHFIAILLNLMTQMDSEQNWQVVKGIHGKNWSERYIWSYYWATTIMLTVGFGDITPTTSDEAIWIIFIEIVSCIAFSYNISCLGSLISTIRSQGVQIDKNRKIFQNMAKKISFSDQLVDKIQNYIDESVKLRNKFNLNQQKQFIESLPPGYKKQVLCQSNKTMLMELKFFGELLQKTIYKLSQSIERHMYHPQEMIRNANSPFRVLILKDGQIGFVCKRKGYGFADIPVNYIKTMEKGSPFLMTLQFITHKNPNYDIKSLCYSIVHELSQQLLLDVLKQVPKDFEYYAYLRDKSKHLIDQYEAIQCKKCKSNHTYFDCPKYHFIPIKEHIIHKELIKLKMNKNDRRKLSKINVRKYKTNSLKNKFNCQNACNILNSDNQAIDLYRYCLNSELGHLQKNIIPTVNQKSDQIEQNQTKPLLLQGDNFITMINDIIKGSVSRQFKEQEYTDEVWGVASDEVWDYNLYFPNDNSSLLAKKWNKQTIIISKFSTEQKFKQEKTLKFMKQTK